MTTDTQILSALRSNTQGVSGAELSQQLGVLRTIGLVNTRRDGKRIFYSIADEKVLKLLETMYGLYCPADKKGKQ